MNLDDLMEVWKSQDASPLHGVNEALLRLALRQDEAKVQKKRRRDRWITYVAVALTVAFLVRFLLIMIHRKGDLVLSGWDYAILVVGVAAALIWARTLSVRQRAQAAREQRFGDSLRDQINRQLMQCDYAASRTGLASCLDTRPLSIICAMALILASWRSHNRTFSDARLWGPIGFMICWIIITVGGAFWAERLLMRRKILPRKRQLEALLKELDGQ